MQGCSDTFSPYWLILPFAFFVAVWCVGLYINGVSSGWHRLSRRFRAPSKFNGQMKSTRPFFNVCMKNWVDYSGIIRIAVEEDALHLSVVFAYHIGHPPLSIPWNEIEFSDAKLLWRRYVVLSLGEQERIPMRISERMANKLGILDRLPESRLACGAGQTIMNLGATRSGSLDPGDYRPR